MTSALRLTTFFIALLLGSTPFAQAQNSFTYLKDETEPGGYDVTATLSTLPSEWLLDGQKNGDGYRLKISPTSVELSLQEKGKARRLAAEQANLKAGQFLAQRRGSIWRFYLDHRLILEAEHEGTEEGLIGFRGNVKDARLQPVEDVYFDDDFMRVAKDVAMEEALKNPKNGVRISTLELTETIWKTLLGAWSTTGLSENDQAQVAQSANPFVFQSDEKGINLAVAGRDFWDDYETEVAVKPEGTVAIGLAVYVQDEKNYLLFHWPQNGPRQLRAVVNGKTQVLDESPGGYDQKQWYKLRFSIADGTLRAFVDDGEVLRARTRLFGRGLVGLYAENAAKDQNAVFDDVTVRTVPERHDDFSRKVAGRWHNIAGDWLMQGSAKPAATSGAYAVMGQSDWTEYSANADITLPADAAAGLLLHHEAGGGAYLLRVTGSKAKWPYAGRTQILKIADGKSEVLADIETDNRFDNSTRAWSFSSENGYLRARADGRRIADAYDTSLPDGRAGIYAQRGAGEAPALQSFVVAFPRPRHTWAKVPDLYVEERQAETMGGWSTPQGLWSPASPLAVSSPDKTIENAATKPEKTLWHKGTFWGDSSIRFPLPELKLEEHLNLLLGSGPNALQLTFSLSEGKLKTVLTHADLKPADSKPPLATGEWPIESAEVARQIEVARRGSYLLVRVEQEEEWSTLLAARVY